MEQLTSMCDMVGQYIQKKEEEKQIEEEKAAKDRYWKILASCDDDDDYNFAITPNEPVDSLIMGDEHLNIIPAMESDELIKSNVENLVPNPSESEGENECDVPACFTTFLNTLFDADYDFYSVNDQSLSDEDFPKEIYSNPLFDEEIIFIKIDPHHFNVESDLIESLLNHDSSIISSSSKIDSLFNEFTGELTLLKSIPLGISETDCDPENEIRLTKRLLYDNSSPRPRKEFVSENSNAAIESFSPSPIPIKDSNISDIPILEELLDNYSLSLPENESFHFDIPLSSHPPAKPPDARSHTAKTFDLVWMWLGGDCGNLFLMGYTGIQWYALTINPTVYVSHIRQFWSTARIETTDEGTKILATVDGISSLPDAELFDNLALMGYNILPNQKFTFQKGQFSHQWKYLIHTIMQCLSPKSTGFNEFSSNIATAVGEGLGTPTEPHHTPSPEASQSPQHDLSSSIHPPITTATIPTVIPTDIPTLSQGEAFSIVFGLEAEQDRENIIKTSALPHDSPPRVTSFAVDEGSMQHKLHELTDLCTRLQRQQTEMASKIAAQDLEITSLKARIKLLEDKDGGGAEPFGKDATIKWRSLETGEEAGVEKSTERGSNDTKELVHVLTSLDAASILTNGVQVVSVPPTAEVATIGIPTGSGLVPTASPIFTTASVVTPYSRRKGKEKMVESDTSKKKKLHEHIDVQVAREMEEQLAEEDHRRDEQIARDAEVARIHVEEELQMLIDGLDRNNETIAKYLQEYEQFAADFSIGEKIDMINELVKYQDHYAKGMTLKEIREKFIPVWKHIEDFVPMASKEEGERFKRKGIDMLKHFDREDLSQLRTLVKETLSIRQATSDKEKELWVELKRLYELDVKDQLWTHTQALMHDLVEWRLYDTCGVHHVLTRDQEIFLLVEKDYPLRKGLAIVMKSNKLQVENYSQMATDLILKIHKIANSPRQRDD
nr:hypothetical protein [Tanacetum cinerariifolium]